MAVEPSHHHARKAFRVERLAPVRAHQAERLIQMAFRVGDARRIIQAAKREIFLGLRRVVRQMHEGKLHALRFDLPTEFAQLGDRLAAKRSTKVPQKNQQNGA